MEYHITPVKMTKKKTTTLTKEIIEKPMDSEAIRESLMILISDKTWVWAQYKKADTILKKLVTGEKITEEDQKDLNKLVNSINPFKTHKFLLWLVKEEDERNCIMEFSEDIAKEYDCKTSMELSLCETIASSYYSMIKWSQQMQRMYSIEYLSNEKNGYYSMISKEVEKQSRLYMSAMMTLRALKSPSTHVSIKAKNAFIWENQQFNHNQNHLWENP